MLREEKNTSPLTMKLHSLCFPWASVGNGVTSKGEPKKPKETTFHLKMQTRLEGKICSPL
jgi:hypothetical protein